MRRFLPIASFLALLVLLGYALSPHGRNVAESAALLADVWAVGRAPAKAPPSLRGVILYDGPGGGKRIADLYCDPGLEPGGRLLLAHGLVAGGKDDARLRALGDAFARHRFLVLVPDFPGLRSLRLGPGDVDEMASALQALGRLDGCMAGPVDHPPAPLPTGAVGFSYSAGPLLLALDRPGRQADFAVLFGGYHDLEDLIRFLTTGRHRDRGVEFGGEALPEGRWILLEADADLLGDPADRGALAEIGRRRRLDRNADIAGPAARLGPAGRAVLDLLSNTDPGRFDPLLQRIDPALRRALSSLSPSRSLVRPLALDLYLLHGRSDAIIPFTESLKLAREVRTTGRIELVLLGGFQHARPGGVADPWWRAAIDHPADSFHLFRILTEILARRRENP